MGIISIIMCFLSNILLYVSVDFSMAEGFVFIFTNMRFHFLLFTIVLFLYINNKNKIENEKALL